MFSSILRGRRTNRAKLDCVRKLYRSSAPGASCCRRLSMLSPQSPFSAFAEMTPPDRGQCTLLNTRPSPPLRHRHTLSMRTLLPSTLLCLLQDPLEYSLPSAAARCGCRADCARSGGEVAAGSASPSQSSVAVTMSHVVTALSVSSHYCITLRHSVIHECNCLLSSR